MGVVAFALGKGAETGRGEEWCGEIQGGGPGPRVKTQASSLGKKHLEQSLHNLTKGERKEETRSCPQEDSGVVREYKPGEKTQQLAPNTSLFLS